MIHEIIDNIYIGSWQDAREYEKEFIVLTVAWDSPYKNNYYFYQLIDGENKPSDSTRDLFNSSVRKLIELRKENEYKKILVHCVSGQSRAPAVVAGYIIKKYKISSMDALDYIKSLRNIIKPSNGFIELLKELENNNKLININDNQFTNTKLNKIENELEKFYIYLSSELSKLKNEGDAIDFLSKLRNKDLERLHIHTELYKLMNQFKNKNEINNYLKTLNYYEIIPLTNLISKIWRKNAVYEFLINNSFINKEKIPVEYIYVLQAESNLKHLFKRNNYKLTDLVNDKKLWNHEPYKSNFTKGKEVEYPLLLAEKYSETRYTIYDGIHRAIQMARNGQEYIDLYYTES